MFLLVTAYPGCPGQTAVKWLVVVIVVKYMNIAVRSLTCHTATGTHMPYRITQCYLPPDRGDIPAKDEGRKAK